MAASVSRSKGDRESVLRRLAIVLREMPEADCHRLTNFLEEDLSDSLHQAILNLGVVDEDERQSALSSFISSYETQKEQSANADLLQLSNSGADPSRPSVVVPVHSQVKSSLARLTDDFEKLQSIASSESVSELAFLNRVDPETLSDLLCDEHPQSVALVLASIEPTLAAKILGRMPSSVQHQTMVRIDQLSRIPHAAFQEIGLHFRSKLSASSQSKRTRVGHEALKAIMEVMPLGREQPHSSSQALSASPASLNDFEGELTAEHSTDNEAVEIEQGCVSSNIDFQSNTSGKLTVDGRANPEAKGPPRELNWTKDEVHEYLIQLSPKAFCLALSHVPTNDALLTLSGVPIVVANRVLSLLSRSQAKSVQKKMTRLTSVSLAEIDDAKRKVCMRAHQIAGESVSILKSA